MKFIKLGNRYVNVDKISSIHEHRHVGLVGVRSLIVTDTAGNQHSLFDVTVEDFLASIGGSVVQR